MKRIALTLILLGVTGCTMTEEKSAIKPIEKPLPEILNAEQKAFMEWTETHFASFLDRSEYASLSESDRESLESRWLDLLQSSQGGSYYNAIAGLAAIKSEKAVKPLLTIATEQVEKDNRGRWMATRALGILGDESVVPELIHLIYHYNQSTRFWAQISAVRLTGVNFGADWQRWGRWWNENRGKPPFSSDKIAWTSRAEWADEQMQRQTDKAFLARYAKPKTTVPSCPPQTCIVSFEAIYPFQPETAGQLLNAFHEEHPDGVRTHHYRFEVKRDALIGYICVDTEADTDAICSMLNESDRLRLVEAVLASEKDLQRLYQMGRPSLQR